MGDKSYNLPRNNGITGVLEKGTNPVQSTPFNATIMSSTNPLIQAENIFSVSVVGTKIPFLQNTDVTMKEDIKKTINDSLNQNVLSTKFYTTSLISTLNMPSFHNQNEDYNKSIGNFPITDSFLSFGDLFDFQNLEPKNNNNDGESRNKVKIDKLHEDGSDDFSFNKYELQEGSYDRKKDFREIIDEKRKHKISGSISGKRSSLKNTKLNNIENEKDFLKKIALPDFSPVAGDRGSSSVEADLANWMDQDTNVQQDLFSIFKPSNLKKSKNYEILKIKSVMINNKPNPDNHKEIKSIVNQDGDVDDKAVLKLKTKSNLSPKNENSKYINGIKKINQPIRLSSSDLKKTIKSSEKGNKSKEINNPMKKKKNHRNEIFSGTNDYIF